jgi:flavorubredoxin
MQTIEVRKDLLQFNTFIEPINMSFNQFLLMGSVHLLVHTGTMVQTQTLLPQLKKALSDKPLEYVFISHFESDECGGLSVLLQHYPEVKPVCSAITARQLNGFGITANAIVQSPGKIFQIQDYQFEFISYPSEMHLWEGLMMFEKTRSILFSSDLFGQLGKVEGTIAASDWKQLVNSITLDKVPSSTALEKLQKSLLSLPVSFIAPGHGACIKF